MWEEMGIFLKLGINFYFKIEFISPYFFEFLVLIPNLNFDKILELLPYSPLFI